MNPKFIVIIALVLCQYSGMGAQPSTDLEPRFGRDVAANDLSANILSGGYTYRIDSPVQGRPSYRIILSLPSGEDQIVFEAPATQPIPIAPGADPAAAERAKPIMAMGRWGAIIDGDIFACITSGAIWDSWQWFRWNIPQKKLITFAEIPGSGQNTFRFSFLNERTVERRNGVKRIIELLSIDDRNQVYLEGEPISHVSYSGGAVYWHGPKGGAIRKDANSCMWPFYAERVTLPSPQKTTWIVREDTQAKQLPDDAVFEPGSERPKTSSRVPTPPKTASEATLDQAAPGSASASSSKWWWWMAGGLVAVLAAFAWKGLRGRS